MSRAKRSGRADRMNRMHGIKDIPEVETGGAYQAVRAVCSDWPEMSEHQRLRSVELFEAGRRFEREARKAQEVKS